MSYAESQYVIDEISKKIDESEQDSSGTGIPPLPPSSFEASEGNQSVTLSWSAPERLILDNKTVCMASGVMIRRSTTGYPATETDGDLVLNSKNLEGTYSDTGLTNDTEYFYRAFVYSDHNVYNRDTVGTRASATPTGAAVIGITCPPVMEGQTLTISDGTNTYTVTVTDGKAKQKIYQTGTYTVAGIEVVIDALATYYPVDIVVFAAHYSEADSNPDSVDYPQGYSNYGWTPFAMDLSTGVPNYNDWDPEGDNAERLKWLYPRSCMLKYDGTVDYYLDENDETKKEDGVTASDVANANYGGNAMMEWGQDGRRIYWKIVADTNNDGWTFIAANADVLGCKPWNHYDVNGNPNMHFYVHKYFGSSSGGKLRSISGQTNYVNNAGTSEISLAEANNTTSDKIWTTGVFCDTMLLGLLCVLLGKSLNTQAKFGSGRTASGNTSAIGQGTMNGKGMFFGKSNGTDGVKVFGTENLWGNLYQRIRGLININGSYRIKMTYSQVDGSTTDGYNTDGSGYINAGSIGTTAAWVYPKHDIIRENCLLAQTNGGAENTYYCDGTYLEASGTFYAFVGGVWNVAGRAGVFCVSLSGAVSYASASVGAALSCKPLAAA